MAIPNKRELHLLSDDTREWLSNIVYDTLDNLARIDCPVPQLCNGPTIKSRIACVRCASVRRMIEMGDAIGVPTNEFKQEHEGWKE